MKKRSIYMHYKVVHKISASSMKNLVRPWFFDSIIDNSKPEIWKSIEFIEIYVIEIPNLAKTELWTYNAALWVNHSGLLLQFLILQNIVTSSKYLVMHALRDRWIQHFDDITIFCSIKNKQKFSINELLIATS